MMGPLDISRLDKEWKDEFVRESNAVEDIFEPPGTPYWDNHMYALGIALGIGADKRVEVDLEVILKLHQHLMRDIMPRKVMFEDRWPAGELREVGVHVGGNMCPNPASVPYFLDRVIEEAQKLESGDTFEKTHSDCWNIHYAYECVHPFIDGNGRSGRLLLALLCVRLGVVPLIVYHNARRDYYDDIQDFRNLKAEKFFGREL